MKILILVIAMAGCISGFASAETVSPQFENQDKPSSRQEIPRGKYITGGVLASTVGFGIGHAVQGRYWNKGWIFTATEVAGLAVLSRANCFRSRDSNSTDRAVRERSDCEDVLAGLTGASVLIGFHAWEIVDAWTQAKPFEQASEISILPKSDGILISLSSSF